MNFFDSEEEVMNLFRDFSSDPVIIPSNSVRALEVYNKIKFEEKWTKWTNNSSKSDPPPDYYSQRYKLMMEVMRIDDHGHFDENGRFINPVNQKESKLQKELHRKYPQIAMGNSKVMINAVSDLSGNEDHNFGYYLESFKHALSKHIAKIPLYRKNHPDKKLIFFIFDESSAYVLVNDRELCKRGSVAGEPYSAMDYNYWQDKRFLDVFIDADIDFLIWYAPYKMIISESEVYLPNTCVFDLKKCDPQMGIDYPIDYIMSSES